MKKNNVKILLSLRQEDLDKLDLIKEELGLGFRNSTISFLVNRYCKKKGNCTSEPTKEVE